jgi:hypothetical protein
MIVIILFGGIYALYVYNETDRYIYAMHSIRTSRRDLQDRMEKNYLSFFSLSFYFLIHASNSSNRISSCRAVIFLDFLFMLRLLNELWRVNTTLHKF